MSERKPDGDTRELGRTGRGWEWAVGGGSVGSKTAFFILGWELGDSILRSIFFFFSVCLLHGVCDSLLFRSQDFFQSPDQLQDLELKLAF